MLQTVQNSFTLHRCEPLVTNPPADKIFQSGTDYSKPLTDGTIFQNNDALCPFTTCDISDSGNCGGGYTGDLDINVNNLEINVQGGNAGTLSICVSCTTTFETVSIDNWKITVCPILTSSVLLNKVILSYSSTEPVHLEVLDLDTILNSPSNCAKQCQIKEQNCVWNFNSPHVSFSENTLVASKSDPLGYHYQLCLSCSSPDSVFKAELPWIVKLCPLLMKSHNIEDINLRYLGPTAEDYQQQINLDTVSVDPDCQINSCTLKHQGCLIEYTGEDLSLSQTGQIINLSAKQSNPLGYTHLVCIRCTNLDDIDNLKIQQCSPGVTRSKFQNVQTTAAYSHTNPQTFTFEKFVEGCNYDVTYQIGSEKNPESLPPGIKELQQNGDEFHIIPEEYQEAGKSVSFYLYTKVFNMTTNSVRWGPFTLKFTCQSISAPPLVQPISFKNAQNFTMRADEVPYFQFQGFVSECTGFPPISYALSNVNQTKSVQSLLEFPQGVKQNRTNLFKIELDSSLSKVKERYTKYLWVYQGQSSLFTEINLQVKCPEIVSHEIVASEFPSHQQVLLSEGFKFPKFDYLYPDCKQFETKIEYQITFLEETQVKFDLTIENDFAYIKPEKVGLFKFTIDAFQKDQGILYKTSSGPHFVKVIDDAVEQKEDPLQTEKEEDLDQNSGKDQVLVPIYLDLEMRKSGLLRITPSEPILVPELFAQNSSQLLEEVFNIQFKFIKREEFQTMEEQQNSTMFARNVSLASWTQKEILIQIDFEQPLQISRLYYHDSLHLQVANQTYIKSIKTGVELYQEDPSQKEKHYRLTIPKQLLKSGEEKTLLLLTQTLLGISTAGMIIKIIASIILKHSISRIKRAFIVAQIIGFSTTLQVFYPANVQLVLEEILSFIRFTYISPKAICKLIISHQTFIKFFGSRLYDDREIPQNLINSGFENSSFINTSSLLIPIFVASLVLVMLANLLFRCQKIKDKIEEKIAAYKNKMLWNGIIDMINIEFLPQSQRIASFIIIKFIETEKFETQDIIILSIQIIIIAIIWGIITRIFYKYSTKEYADLSNFDQIKNLTEQTIIKPKNESETIMKLKKMKFVFYLMWRFLFAMITPIFYKKQLFQVIFLINFKLAFIMYDLWVEAEKIEPQTFVRFLHSVENFLHISLYWMMLLFSDFVPDVMVQYKIGKIFIFVALLLIAVNVIIVLWPDIEQFTKIEQMIEDLQDKRSALEKNYPIVIMFENMSKEQLLTAYFTIYQQQIKFQLEKIVYPESEPFIQHQIDTKAKIFDSLLKMPLLHYESCFLRDFKDRDLKHYDDQTLTNFRRKMVKRFAQVRIDKQKRIQMAIEEALKIQMAQKRVEKALEEEKQRKEEKRRKKEEKRQRKEEERQRKRKKKRQKI